MYIPFGFSWPLHFDNYSYAFATVGPYIFNSVVITVISTVLIIILSSMGGVFDRYEFPGKGFLYMAIISLMMVPGILSLVPLFLLSDSLGILDTKLSIILPGIRTQIPMAVFLIRVFMEGIKYLVQIGTIIVNLLYKTEDMYYTIDYDIRSGI
jgi:multiple sugar transport system permease protein/raffinose/stachyose/melibiose transport system permease protein